MGEPKLPGESIWTAEGFGSKGSEVIDVLGLSSPEERLKQGIFEHAGVKRVF